MATTASSMNRAMNVAMAAPRTSRRGNPQLPKISS
jgi:hypothetical protein